ncbi:MAG: YraN family protein [Microcoleaceae cyanobacterium]
MSGSLSGSSPVPNAQQIGTLGEQFVAQWLYCQNWQILQHQYRTRWGEIDLIAIHSTTDPITPEKTVIFVEVKTRNHRNWDSDGLLAITPTKQEKLMISAQYFLSQYPELAECPCRFDVALVRWQPWVQPINQQTLVPQSDLSIGEFPHTIDLGQPVNISQGCLTLQQYIKSAFSMS